MGRARSVAELRAAVTRTTVLAWVNTIAADRRGDALYADVSAVPNVSAGKLQACATATITGGCPNNGANFGSVTGTIGGSRAITMGLNFVF